MIQFGSICETIANLRAAFEREKEEGCACISRISRSEYEKTYRFVQ